MKLICGSILFFFCYVLSAQRGTDSLMVKNHVKEIRILDSKNKVVSIDKFNVLGKKVYNALDDFGGSTFLKTSTTWFYNELGILSKTIMTHSSFPEPTVWLYKYDENGNQTEIKTEDDRIVFKFFYDSSGYRIKELAYADDGNVRQTTTYEKAERKTISRITGDFIKNRTNTSFFDDDGNQIKSESYDGNKVNFATVSIYEKDKLLKTTYDDGEGSNYKYDTKGRLTKRQNFKTEGGVEVLGNYEEFTYNEIDLIETYVENIYSISDKPRA